MILEIIRNALAFGLMLSDCLHSTIFSTCRQILISSRPIHYECFLFTHLATCTCTILFQTRANQLIWSSQCLLTCLSLFGTKIGANTSTLHWETYLYHSLSKISHFDPLTNHKRCKTSRVRDKGHCTKNGGFRASSVVQLHYVPFQMQITTADQLVFFVLLWVNFVLPWVNFVLPWVNFVLPWINGVLTWVHFVLPSHNIVLPWVILFCRELILFCRELMVFCREFILFCRHITLCCRELNL